MAYVIGEKGELVWIPDIATSDNTGSPDQILGTNKTWAQPPPEPMIYGTELNAHQEKLKKQIEDAKKMADESAKNLDLNEFLGKSQEEVEEEYEKKAKKNKEKKSTPKKRKKRSRMEKIMEFSQKHSTRGEE